MVVPTTGRWWQPSLPAAESRKLPSPPLLAPGRRVVELPVVVVLHRTAVQAPASGSRQGDREKSLGAGEKVGLTDKKVAWTNEKVFGTKWGWRVGGEVTDEAQHREKRIED